MAKELYKIILVGDSRTGKTSISSRAFDNNFTESYVPTYGVVFKTKNDDSRKVKLQLWDASGQERFRQIVISHYKDSDIMVIVYDISDRESFNNLEMWLQEIKKPGLVEFESVGFIILGNKSDLDNKRQVSITEGQDLPKTINVMHIEYSA